MTPILLAALLLGLDTPESVCFASDVAKLCCPSACAVKNSPKWEQTNEVLRECMKGIGSSDGESKDATVSMRCKCEKS